MRLSFRALTLASLTGVMQASAQEAPPAKPEGLVLHSAQVLLEPGGEPVALAGGCWLSTRACIGSAQRLAAAEAEVRTLEAEPARGPLRVVVVSLLVGAALGAATAVALHQILPGNSRWSRSHPECGASGEVVPGERRAR